MMRLPIPQLPQPLARWCALLGALAAVLLLCQSLHGLGWTKTIPIPAAKILPLENGWKAAIPERYRTALVEDRGEILENGLPLGTPARSRRDFENSGGPRYHLARSRSYALLRTADLTNPSENGRAYALRIPYPIPVWSAGVAFGVFLLGAASWRRQPSAIPPVGSRLWKWMPLLLTVAAASLRLGEIAADPDFHDGVLSIRGMPYSDAVMWNEMGLSLTEGRGLAGGFDGQRPFYSYLLGCIFCFSGPSVLAPQILNAFCHGISVGLVFLFGCALGARLLGFAAAAMVVFTGEHAYQVRVIMTEQAGLVLMLTGLLVLLNWRQKPDGGRWKQLGLLLLAGILLGLGNLACPVALFGLPFFCLLVSRPGPCQDDVRAWWRRWDFRPGIALGLGACLVFVPWLARQKSVHGIATLSTQTADLLYATASTNGPLGGWMGAELEAHGISSVAGPTPERYAYFMKRFAETVREDPVRYAAKLGRAALKFACHPVGQTSAAGLIVLLVLLAAAVHRWWRGGGAAPLLVWAGSAPAVWWLLDGMGQVQWSLPSGDEWPDVNGTWFPAVLAAAFLLLWWKTPANRPLLALLAAVLVGCAITHAVAGATLLRRSSVFADWAQWLILLGALLWLQRWLSGGMRPVPEEHSALDPAVTAQNPLVGGAVVMLALVSLTGAGAMILAKHPAEPPEPSESERREILAWVESAAPSEVAKAGGVDALRVLPARLGPYRTFIPAHEDASDFGRLFFRQPFDRTVLMVRPPAKSDRRGGRSQQRMVSPISAIVRDADLRAVPADQWFMVVALPDVDRNAKLHHDPVILRVLAVLPIGKSGAASRDAARVFALP
ncbi:MAG: phospholipid carrier-dependent glycosyltransferase [Verrucomicrobiales bacterium]|nr:phospholipid carrier-dependent glycosyltransferase [Verrucomicrobiales bacterium]